MILVKKALRDLWGAKLRTISIVLAIILSVGMGIGLVNATQDAFETFNDRFDDTDYEDIDIHFEMTGINITEINALEGVELAMGRLFIPTQVRIADKKYEAHWISAPYHPREPYSFINGYSFAKGSYFGSNDSREGLIGNLFARENGIEPGTEVSILHGNLSIDLNISGIVGSPEYLYVVSDAGWPQPSLMVPLFTTYEMTISELGLPENTYNELLIRVEKGSNVNEVKENIEDLLTKKDVRITRSILGTEEMDYQFSKADADGMGKMGWAFGIIILVVTGVVIYNTMTRLISSQRSYIGVMGALGGKRGTILLHYTMFGLFMGIIGSFLGIFAGIGISYMIMYGYSGIIGLMHPVYTIFWIYPAIFVLAGIVITTGAAFFGALKAIKIGPREALTSNYQARTYSKKPVIEKLFDSLARNRKIVPRITVRNLSRNRARTILTIVALGFSMILVFATLAMALSFLQPIEKNYDDYEKWDLEAGLADYVLAEEVADILGSPSMQGIGGEPYLNDYVPLRLKGEMTFAHVQAFVNHSQLRTFHVIEGEKNFDKGVLVGSILAKRLELEPGSQLQFVIGNVTSTATVTGITGELLDESIFMTLYQAEKIMYTAGYVNSVIIDQGVLSRDQVEEMLRDSLPIASFTYTQDAVDGMKTMMASLTSMFFIFIGFGILAEVLFVSTTVVLNVLDREMEFISLRALGATPGKVRNMVVGESLVVLMGGLVIGLPLGLLATRWTMSYLVQDLMYFEMEIGLSAYLLTAVIAAAATIAAAMISGRHITEANLADTIRQRIIT